MQTLNHQSALTIQIPQSKSSNQAPSVSIESTSMGRGSGFDDSPFSLSLCNGSSRNTSFHTELLRTSSRLSLLDMGPVKYRLGSVVVYERGSKLGELGWKNREPILPKRWGSLFQENQTNIFGDLANLEGESSTLTAAAMVKSGDNMEIQRPAVKRDRNDDGGIGRSSGNIVSPGLLSTMSLLSLRPQTKSPFVPKSTTTWGSAAVNVPSTLNVSAPAFQPSGLKMQASAPAFIMPRTNDDVQPTSVLWETNANKEFVSLEHHVSPTLYGTQQIDAPRSMEISHEQKHAPQLDMHAINNPYISLMHMSAQMPFGGGTVQVPMQGQLSTPQQPYPPVFQEDCQLYISDVVRPAEEKGTTLSIFDLLNDNEDAPAETETEASPARTSSATPPGWTIIIVDESAFKEQTKIQSDLQKRLTSVRMKAFKSASKCCRSLEKKARLDQCLFLTNADEAVHLSELFAKHSEASIIVYGGRPELPFEYHYSDEATLVENIAKLTGLVARKASTVYGANFTVLWVDEQAFKATGQARKQQLDLLPGCIGVKTYKSADKAIRATSKKQRLENTLVMVSEHEANDLIKYLATRDEPIPLIVECAAGSKWHAKENYDVALIMVSTSWEHTHDNMASFAFEHMGAE